MDVNIVIVSGRLAANAEVRTFASGSQLVRYLVTVRSDEPRRRVDVVPVTLWDPDHERVLSPGVRGDRVWCVGSVQRRFWSSDGAKRSRIEVVAHAIQFLTDDPVSDLDDGADTDEERPAA